MSSALPTSKQRLTSMALMALVVAVGVFVIELFADDAESTSASTTTAPIDVEEETPIDELVGDYSVTGAAPLARVTELQGALVSVQVPGVTVTADVIDREAAVGGLCSGDLPVVNTVGLLSADEVAACETAGTEVVTIRRAVEAIVVFTSPANDAVECVSVNDLYALLSAEAEEFTSWADAFDLTDAWGGAELPGARLEVFGPEPCTATHDALSEIVLARVARGETGLDPASREFTTEVRTTVTTGDAEATVAAVAASNTSLGWASFADVEDAIEAGTVTPLRISLEDGGTCIGANPETVEAAAFPAAIHLYTHVNAEFREAEEALQAWLTVALEEDGGLAAVEEAGYALLPNADLNRARTIWKTGITGQAQWGG